MRVLHAFFAGTLLLGTASLARTAAAHPAIGAPTAYPNTPATVGIVASSTFTFTWLDYNRPIPTGTATIDWYYATQNPRTYLIGAVPEDLSGELIVSGIAESDTTNAYTWDLAEVPSGSYFLWSKVTEPPEEVPILELYSFSQGVLTVHHPGDPIHPAVCFNKPDNPFTLVDQELELVLEVFDPDGSGRLKLEIFSRDTPDQMVTIFEDRPAAPRIVEPLDTSILEEGDYGLRFSIIDGRGLAFNAYTRWFFRVSHRLEEPDAGGAELDASASDAGLAADLGSDLGVGDGAAEAPDSEGCGCEGSPSSQGPPSTLAILLGLLVVLGRRRISDAGPRTVR